MREGRYDPGGGDVHKGYRTQYEKSLGTSSCAVREKCRDRSLCPFQMERAVESQVGRVRGWRGRDTEKASQNGLPGSRGALKLGTHISKM